MRALRVVGLGEDGQTVVLEDPERGERFTLPADDRLRAAARGDLPKLGQAQIELDAQLRPREIQTRIRAGESVEQLAAAAGMDPQRVERYAYPVLLERSRTADLAQRAHPVREDGPDVQTLGEVVSHAFGLRGQDYESGSWDSWRGEDGKWVVQLLWRAGRSDIRAHWIFHPGAHGGTVTPLDEHAADLIDPTPNRSLRTVRPVTQLARQALELDEQEQSALPPADAGAQQAMTYETNGHGRYQPEPLPAELDPASVESEADAVPATVTAEADEHEPEADRRTEPAARKGRKNHPIVPSWEDVLLGVRSNRG